METIPENEKPQIIQELLNQKYQAEHLMRERSTNFTKWILGFGLGFIWILLSQKNLSLPQQIIIVIFISLLAGASIYFIYDICKGFKNNRNIVVKLEDCLKLHDKGIYTDGFSLYPSDYKIDYKKKCKTPSHFKTLYMLIFITGVIIILITIFHPNPNSKNIDNKSKNIEKVTNIRR